MANKNIYKAAVIGCGRIGCGDFDDGERRKSLIYGHTQSYVNCPRTSLVALSDINSDQLHKNSEKFKVSAYTDYNEMLQTEDIDIISICTSPSSHCDIINDCLNYNIRAIYCEKPIDTCIKKAEKTARRCKEKKVLLAFNHQRRFGEFHQDFARVIQNKEIGTIQNICVNYGAGIANTGTHFIDLLHFYLNKKIKWVYGVKSKNTCPLKSDVNIDGIASFEGGPLLTIQSSNAFGIFEIILLADKGRFTVNLHYPFTTEPALKCEKVVENSFFEGAKKLEYCENFSKTYWSKSYDHNYMVYAIKDIVKCLDLKNYNILSDSRTAIDALRVIDAFVLSCETQSKVSI